MDRKTIFAKSVFFTFIFVLIFLLLTSLGVGIWGYWKWRQFSKAADVSFSEIKQLVKTGLNTNITQNDEHKNILLLGTDSLKTRGEIPPLTDTLMLISVDLNIGKINTLSLPRDLWSEKYQTRINALYAYGQEKLAQDAISEMINLPIHHSLVLSMDQVSEIIDLLGGVEVTVPVAFKDEAFPREDVDVRTEHDPAKLYKTIEFKVGKQTMSGQTALEYMRSRKSGDDEGTDLARSSRQQLVMEAVLTKLKQRSTLLNTKLLGQLFKYYQTNFNQSLPMTELITVAKKLSQVNQSQLTINQQSLNIFPDDPQGVIYHPDPKLYQKQWLYVIKNQANFTSEIKNKLYEK